MLEFETAVKAKSVSIYGVVASSYRQYHLIECIAGYVRAYRRLCRMIIFQQDILLYEIEVYQFYKWIQKFCINELFYIHGMKHYVPAYMKKNFEMFQHVILSQPRISSEPATYGAAIFDLEPKEKMNSTTKSNIMQNSNNRFSSAKNNSLVQSMKMARKNIEIETLESISSDETHRQQTENARLTVRQRIIAHARLQWYQHYGRILQPGEDVELQEILACNTPPLEPVSHRQSIARWMEKRQQDDLNQALRELII